MNRMLELHATPRFAGWFEALTDADAEAVATAVEVLRARADHDEPCGSPYLLWYRNAACDSSALQRRLQSHLHSAELTRAVLRRMESQHVRARYRELPQQLAQRVDQALEGLRRWAVRTPLERGRRCSASR
jgi:hypothetical protein